MTRGITQIPVRSVDDYGRFVDGLSVKQRVLALIMSGKATVFVSIKPDEVSALKQAGRPLRSSACRLKATGRRIEEDLGHAFKIELQRNQLQQVLKRDDADETLAIQHHEPAVASPVH